MGVHVFALITEWPPMVADFRKAGDLGFYRNLNMVHVRAFFDAQEAGRPAPKRPEQLLPYATAYDYPAGKMFLCAPDVLGHVIPRLPDDLGVPLTAFAEMLYGRFLPDDVAHDAGVERDYDNVLWSMRPQTVLRANKRADAVPWGDLCDVAEGIEIPPMAGYQGTLGYHVAEQALSSQRYWISQAAAAGRGVVAVASY